MDVSGPRADNPDMAVLEREPQLAALEEYADEAATGSGRLVLIAGEAGVGKSTVVEELERRLPDVVWLSGACDGMFTPRILGPLHDVAAAVGGDLAELCRSEAPREQLFAALLQHVARGPFTVLVVEDVHWADEATLDLLRFLSRRLRDAPVLTLVTYRDDGGGAADDALRTVLGDLGVQRGTRRIDLPPLSPRAVAQLGGATGWDPHELHRLTGGNPFFLTEVLHARPGTIPGSARDAVLARAAGLTPSAQRTLWTAALLGSTVDPALLRGCVGELAGTVDDLLRRGLLESTDHALRFRHELARLAVVESVPAHHRAGLHAAILTQLVAAGCGDDIRLVFHADGCSDADTVRRHAPRAAARASQMGSHRQAAAQYRLALRHAGNAPGVERAGLLDRLADELVLLDDFGAAAVVFEEAIALHVEDGDLVRRADSLRRFSRALSSLSRQAEARSTAEEAVRLLEPLGPSRELAWAHAGLAGLHMLSSMHGLALEAARRAQELAAELDLPDVLSDALNTEACVLGAQGGAWREPMQRALDIALMLPHPPLAARAYNNLYTFLTLDQHPVEAEHVFHAAMAHARDHDIATYHRCMRGDRAFGLLGLGRWEEALAQAHALIDEPGTSTQNWLVPKLVIGLVGARREQADAWPSLDEALAVAEELQLPQYLVPILVGRAEAAWLEGDREKAAAELDRAAASAPVDDVSLTEQVQLWSHRLGRPAAPMALRLEPMRLELGGDPAGAARSWDKACCSYDAALALLGSDRAEHLQEAVVRLDALGATATARHARRRLRTLGARVPSPARSSTRAHPRGLTAREQEVLVQLAAGMTNEQIARRLVIATRTVDHHVAAVLAKLGVANRREACVEAERLGLLGAEDGQSPALT